MKLLPLLALVVIVLFLAGVIRKAKGPDRAAPRPNDLRITTEESLTILNNRYARGEISKEEYMRMKKDILGF